LEVAVKLFANPNVLRLALALFTSIFVCLATVVLVRRLRRNASQAASLDDPHADADQLPLHTYNAVIQELKQEKHELLSAQQAERRRAKTSESISAAVLSHLPCGVLFFTGNGLVRQSNAAAKHILGFASPSGMSVNEIFRDTKVMSGLGSEEQLAAAVQGNLQENIPTQSWDAQYVTPSGEQRILEVTVTPVHSGSDDLLGVTCLITDKTEVALLQRQEELRGEMSGEMALALRTSLTTIASYAREIAVNRDPQRTQALAADIVSEAAELDHTVGGFLAGTKAAAAEA
jgi:nitrogen fixation/metabolism regulation signal transduction histidine kinase